MLLVDAQRLRLSRCVLTGSSERGRHLRQPKIQNLGMPALGDKNVGRLDVAVNNPSGMGRIQRVGNLNRESEQEFRRYRRKLVESQAAERNRLLKSANIKLASVATDVFGTSGRLMLRALIAGKATAQEMAELAQRKLRSKIPQLQLALEGKLEGHHCFLLKLQLDRLERAEGDLAVLEQRIQEKLEPYAAQLALLREIPGVDWTLAAVIIAELGVDMSVFQSVSQLASWAGVCPGNNESAGKRKSSRIPKGNVYLKTALVEAAHAAARTKGTFLRDKFYRLKARRGYKRAVVVIGHKILVSVYHMVSQNVSYNDLGDLYLDKLNKNHLTRNLVHRLERLGYSVILAPQQKAA